MLQVCIHHGHEGRRRGQNSLDARRGQSTPSDAVQHTQIVMVAGQPPHHIRGAVGRVVIHKNHFVVNARKRPRQAIDHRTHVSALVKCGQHDRQIVGHALLRCAQKVAGLQPATARA